MFFGLDKTYIDPFSLEGWNPFFRKLKPAEQEKFIERLQNFIAEKDFEGREELVITDEIKIRICAAAIQLTFGFDEYLLPRFQSIIVYPGVFYSRRGKDYHKGETSSSGAIVFAWDYFKEGFAHAHDRINLGLHEWAHALMVSGFFEEGGSEHFKQYYNKWRMEAEDEFDEIENYKDIFREYGGSSMAEFFAVSVEVFFEDAEGFKDKAPSLFRHFCILLNQFPLGSNRDLLALETDIINTPQNIRIVILPEKSQVKAIIIFTLIILVLVGGFAFAAGTPGILIIVSIGIGLQMFRTVYEGYIYRNRLAISSNHISVRNRKDIILQDYLFHELSGVHLSKKKARDELYFSYLENNTINEKRFIFRLDDEKIKVLGDALKEQKVPFTISKET